MRCLRLVFLISALLAVAIAVPVNKQIRDAIDMEEVTPPQSHPATPEESAAPTTAIVPEVEALQPSASPAAIAAAATQPIVPQISEVLTPPPPRRIITFDQRQEGKYNIRADLENFMIVVIPSSPASGASLLDLLSRTNQKKSHHGAGKYSHHKKYLAPSKAASTPEADNPESSRRQPNDTTEEEAVRRYQTAVAAKPHFIEGRTPYHVDISSSGELQQPQNRRLDAIPALRRSSLYARSNSPVYRLLPADSADQVMAILPIKGNHAVTVLGVNGGGGDGGAGAGEEISGVAGPRRFIRSLTSYVNQNEVYHNSVVNRAPIDEDSTNNDDVESNRGFVDLTDTSNSFDSLNVGNVDRYAGGATSDGGDGWDRLTLLGAQEQCGPDRRRDSYGVCQFVPLD